MRHGYIHALKLLQVYALAIYMHSNYIKYTPWLYTCTQTILSIRPRSIHTLKLHKVCALAIYYTQTTSSIRLGYIHTLKLHKVCALAIYMHSNYIKYTPWLYTYSDYIKYTPWLYTYTQAT